MTRACAIPVLALVAAGWVGGAEPKAGVATAIGADVDGLHHRTLTSDEIATLWAQKPARNAAHRAYIYIDEEDIVDEYELPIFRVEALRFGWQRQMERVVGGDPGAAARLADLAPALARETVMRRRSEGAFYTSRPGVARDVPATPDLVGPVFSWLRSRR